MGGPPPGMGPPPGACAPRTLSFFCSLLQTKLASTVSQAWGDRRPEWDRRLEWERRLGWGRRLVRVPPMQSQHTTED